MSVADRTRTDRKRRAEQRAATRTYGPDTAAIEWTHPDGWTIRRPTRLRDVRREGTLMRNCLTDRTMQQAYGPEAIGYSLRDPENFPRLTICHYPAGLQRLSIPPGSTYTFGRANTDPKPTYLTYVQAWLSGLPYPAHLEFTPGQALQIP